ncbi:DUF4435 domain-containing protein [Reichenbachiella agariperforans]|uniref:DUF4435 domain-containing protein n=1 Tax=Reichenbachiella agariperforans TaxID=156994 RepID=UPI001C0A39DA|nr:DUF4435 domain-containing protein [Reichenbachiella agariperforans]MBU2915370.1 DUF4435 domain-containing protein [Reichenbachiella agariperforans]
MIERNTEAKSARSVLFEDFNDIDIYVEDSAVGYQKMYKELLNKAFENKLRIEHIIPIGNRDAVIAECENNQENTGRKRVYIVDGDLYILSVDPITPKDGLFVLPRYCIENYLISKNALIKILYEDEPNLESSEIEERLNFDDWLNQNETELIKLFILYALCKKHCPEIQTVAHKVSKLCSDPTGVVCSSKTNARVQELKQHIVDKIGSDETDIEIKKIEDKLKFEDQQILRYVSGKDYLLPLLFSRIKNSVRSTSDKLNFKMRLAIHGEINELSMLPEYVIE